MPIHLADYIDILGTFSFAVSGAFAAKEKRLDLFGVFILAFVTAIGGGTIRDMLIGDLPVSWMQAPEIGWVIAAGAAGSLFSGTDCSKWKNCSLYSTHWVWDFSPSSEFKKGFHTRFLPRSALRWEPSPAALAE